MTDYNNGTMCASRHRVAGTLCQIRNLRSQLGTCDRRVLSGEPQVACDGSISGSSGIYRLPLRVFGRRVWSQVGLDITGQAVKCFEKQKELLVFESGNSCRSETGQTRSVQAIDWTWANAVLIKIEMILNCTSGIFINSHRLHYTRYN